MNRPDEDERLFIIIIIGLIVIGLVQNGIQRDIRLLDARITNIEAAKP